MNVTVDGVAQSEPSVLLVDDRHDHAVAVEVRAVSTPTPPHSDIEPALPERAQRE